MIPEKTAGLQALRQSMIELNLIGEDDTEGQFKQGMFPLYESIRFNTMKPLLSELMDMHYMVKLTALRDKNDEFTYKCSKCGLVVQVNDLVGSFRSDEELNERLHICSREVGDIMRERKRRLTEARKREEQKKVDQLTLKLHKKAGKIKEQVENFKGLTPEQFEAKVKHFQQFVGHYVRFTPNSTNLKLKGTITSIVYSGKNGQMRYRIQTKEGLVFTKAVSLRVEILEKDPKWIGRKSNKR